MARLDIENAQASACVSLWGGQVLGFKPRHDGRERLYMSPLARLDGSRGIRGGIPLCWPWFGVHQGGATFPVHGYASTRVWRLRESTHSDAHTRLVLQLAEPAGPGFGGDATLALEVLIGRTLVLNLLTTNTGSKTLRFTAALHNYLAVNDVSRIRLVGLAGEYLDNTRQLEARETPQPYCLTAETDRIHLDAAPSVSIVESHCTTVLHSRGHDSIVVWNPWQGGVAPLDDMGRNDYKHMLCVETAVTRGIDLAPGQTHCLSQTLE